MKSSNVVNKLQNLLQPDLQKIFSNLIMPQPNGFMVFGIYNIERNHHEWQVLKYGDGRGTFNQLNQALSWCIADKYQHFDLANEIFVLSGRQSRLVDHVQTQSKILSKSKNLKFCDHVRIKLDNDKIKLNLITTQLNKCVARAKYLQSKGFNDEIARIRRTATV